MREIGSPWDCGWLSNSISIVWIQSSTQEPVIIIPQAAFNFFTPKGTLDLVKSSLAKRPNCINLHRSVYQVAVKIGLDSFIEKRSRSQQRPPFRVVPMIVSNNCSTISSIVDMLKNISAQALNRQSDGFAVPVQFFSRTCEACMTIKSFMRDQPASIRPRRPRNVRRFGSAKPWLLRYFRDLQSQTLYET
jgi:hypothetical protein